MPRSALARDPHKAWRLLTDLLQLSPVPLPSALQGSFEEERRGRRKTWNYSRRDVYLRARASLDICANRAFRSAVDAAFARDREAVAGFGVVPSALPPGHWFREAFALAEDKCAYGRA